MMGEFFYFAIMTYNQEKIITETLNSFRYQIDRYGDGRNFVLIIVDDASKDNTVAKVQSWLKKYSFIFVNVVFKINNTNLGTVKNYQYILDSIPKECNFKILAGDDVLSSNNIFDSYKTLKVDNIKTHVKLLLKDGVVHYDEFQLMDYYDHYINNCGFEYNLKWMRRGCYLHTPSTIYLKQTYIDAECSNLNKMFRLFEDDPTWYSMIKNIPNFNIEFSDTPIVLYRISETSVSNGATNTEFTKELKKLNEIYLKEEKGLWKIYYWFRIHDYFPKIFRINLYVDKIRRFCLAIKYRKNSGFDEFKNRIDTEIINEQKYYNEYIKRG